MTKEPPELAALWKAVGADPADALPRLVLSDWLEERAGEVECGGCRSGAVHPGRLWIGHDNLKWIDCPACHGTGRVSNGYAATAAGLRATSTRVPLCDKPGEYDWCYDPESDRACDLPMNLFIRLEGWKRPDGHAIPYPTAEAALRDLVRAWVSVHGRGVPA